MKKIPGYTTVHVSQSSKNTTIDKNQNILSHIKHRRQLLAWVRACRLATCKHYYELTGGDKVGFIQSVLGSGGNVNMQASSSTAADKSGDSTTELDNHETILKIVNRQDPEEGRESIDHSSNSNHIDCRTVDVKEHQEKALIVELAKNATRKAVSGMVEIHHKTSLESDTDQNGITRVTGSAAEPITSTYTEEQYNMQQQQSNLQETVLPFYKPPPPPFEAPLDSRLPWFYIDLHEKIQGPFDTIQMRQWDAAGYLRDNLLISQNWDGPYQALALLFPDRSRAFLHSILECETENDSEEENRASSTDCDPGKDDEVSWDYAVNCDGTSSFETLWKQRTDNHDKDQPRYQFFNGRSTTDLVSSGSIHTINASNDKMELSPIPNSSHNSESATKASDLDKEEYATVWKCDICRMAKFDTHEEAVEHEHNCNRLSLHNDSSSPVNNGLETRDGPRLLSGDLQPKR